jgi:hypothetical protein
MIILRCRKADVYATVCYYPHKLSPVSLLPVITYRRRHCQSRTRLNHPGLKDTGDNLSPVTTTPVMDTHLWISPRIFVKLRNVSEGILAFSGARGKLIHEKNLKTKISCQTHCRKSGEFLSLLPYCWHLHINFSSFLQKHKYFPSLFWSFFLWSQCLPSYEVS